jgi:hypothetical protein
MNKEILGETRGIYIPATLDKMIEETRKKLGMNRSRFIQYCILRNLQEMSVISAKAHESKDNQQFKVKGEE